MNRIVIAAGIVVMGALSLIIRTGEALANENQEAIDGCIDQLRSVGGPDGSAGGEVLSSEFSQAGTVVMLRDAGGTVWECIASQKGEVSELSVSQAAGDGEGAMDGVAAGAGLGDNTTKVARKACREAVRAKKPDGKIDVVSADFSQANTIVMLADGEGSWRCLSSNDGKVDELVFTAN